RAGNVGGTKGIRPSPLAALCPARLPPRRCSVGRSEALGFDTSLWTAWRVAVFDRGDVRREVSARPRAAPPQAARLELLAAGGPRAGSGTRRRSASGSACGGPRGKNAAQGQTIVFVDESGLTERSHRYRTWAPRGETAVLQYHCSWNLLSTIAGITWWSFYFREELDDL